MIRKQATSLLFVGVLLQYALAAPVSEKTEHKRQIILTAIGIEELLASAGLLGCGVYSGWVFNHGIGKTGTDSIATSPDRDSHQCTGYSPAKHRKVSGWCRPKCFDKEIVDCAVKDICGAYSCCVNNEPEELHVS